MVVFEEEENEGIGEVVVLVLFAWAGESLILFVLLLAADFVY